MYISKFKNDLKVSTLPNGLTVASLENHSPVTTVGVVIKAGSRNEGYDNAGVSHALRIAAGMATKKNTAFGLCRNLQQVGGSMSCTQGREHTLYAVQVIRIIVTINSEDEKADRRQMLNYCFCRPPEMFLTLVLNI